MTTLIPASTTPAFVALQHRFRGLIANFRSRRFVKERRVLPERAFRAAQQNLLLDARAAIEPELYRPFLEWLTELSKSQLAELAAIPVSYDELSGIYPKAPVVSLEIELLWITERLRLEAPRLKVLVKASAVIQQLVFEGAYEEAIAGLDTVQEFLGVSLWSVQLRIALEHLAGGLERQKRYVAQVRGVYRTGLLNFTAYHTSVRNEDRTTLGKFTDDLEARISALINHSDDTKSYDRYRLKNELPSTDAGLADVLRIEQNHGIVDIYETFVAVLQEMARQGPETGRTEVILRCIEELDIDDIRLAKLASLLAPATKNVAPERCTDISDALFDGRVRTAMSLSLSLRSNDPWRYIYAGFALGHNGRLPPPLQVRPPDVARVIGHVQSRCAGSEDSWAQLAKLALNLRGLPLATGLLEFLQQIRRANPDDPWRPWLISLNSPTQGAEDRPWDLGCLTEPWSWNATSAAWYEASCPSESQSQLHRLARATGYLHRTEYNEADEVLGSADERWPAPLRSLRALVRLHGLHALGERQRVIILIASEGARSEAHARFLPVVSALRTFAWRDYKAVDRPLAAPIALHLLWAQEESSETASMMRFATGHALRRIGVTRPSDLDCNIIGIEQHELVYFLRFVCVPDILDLARLFPSTQAILEERQAICGLLAKIDATNSELYQAEIIEIANTLELDEGQWIVDSTRIHVDSDALIRWALRELAEDYERYRDLVDIDVESPQSFEDVLRELESTLAQRSTFVPDNEADAVLVSVLRRLGEEFLTNSTFGLDFYLSKRVRHQSFIGLIRGPLEFAGLITTRESEAGRYHRNDAWVDRFERVDDSGRAQIDEALRTFAGSFDDILSQAKDAFFHLRSTDKPQGMITLNLNDRLIALARGLIRLDLSFPEFIRVALPILWAAIEQSLSAIRTFITSDLKSRISKEFDLVRAQVRNLAEQDSAWLEFDAAMGGAANEVQLKLDEAAQWFVHADTLRRHRLFSLEQILKIGVDTALKSHRGYSPQIRQLAEGDLHLHAANLVFVHDVVFVGLGNARKHSGLKSPQIDVTAKWNEAEATVTLEVISDCRPSNRAEKEKQAESIRNIIKEGTHERRTRIEEGSGFAKLAAVVAQSERGRIEFGFTAHGRFRLVVTYAIVQSTGMVSDAA